MSWTGTATADSRSYDEWLNGIKRAIDEKVSYIVNAVSQGNEKVMTIIQADLAERLQEMSNLAAFTQALARNRERDREGTPAESDTPHEFD